MYQGLLLVVSGPSGAGKSTVIKRFLETCPDVIPSVSVTTRAPRKGEGEGVHYFFRTKQEFEAMLEQDAFLEYADVYGQYYGTPKQVVYDRLKQGGHVLLEIDIQGALQVKKEFEEGVFIFIMPPSMKELKTRIENRGSETKEQLKKRFSSAYEEIQFADRYDYLVVNEDIDQAARKLDSIFVSESCRAQRNQKLYQNLIQEVIEI